MKKRLYVTLVTENSSNHGKNEMIEISVTCPLDTEEEVSVYEAGGITKLCTGLLGRKCLIKN